MTDKPIKCQECKENTATYTARQDKDDIPKKLCIYRGIREQLEDRPMTRWEARDLIYQLRKEGKQK